MEDDILTESNHKLTLDNYKFIGLDASLIGALKSVADYYQLPLTASWIYGMTGAAFLHVLDVNFIEPNGGPPEPAVFQLARNLGIEINGLHEYAEGQRFTDLQVEAWEKARLAVQAKRPVFAKNIDIGNQTSVVIAIDDSGYYTCSWHTGYEYGGDPIPWDHLGLGLCPCIHCVNSRKTSTPCRMDGGLISLHWARLTEAADERIALREALEYIIRLQEEETYTWSGKTYTVGQRAYENWLAALADDAVNKYYFSLFVEILNEARRHAVMFLTEVKEIIAGLNVQLVEDAIQAYSEISSRYQILKEMYPYEEPPVRELKEKELCLALVQELMDLERQAFIIMKKLYSCL